MRAPEHLHRLRVAGKHCVAQLVVAHLSTSTAGERGDGAPQLHGRPARVPGEVVGNEFFCRHAPQALETSSFCGGGPGTRDPPARQLPPPPACGRCGS